LKIANAREIIPAKARSCRHHPRITMSSIILIIPTGHESDFVDEATCSLLNENNPAPTLPSAVKLILVWAIISCRPARMACSKENLMITGSNGFPVLRLTQRRHSSLPQVMGAVFSVLSCRYVKMNHVLYLLLRSAVRFSVVMSSLSIFNNVSFLRIPTLSARLSGMTCSRRTGLFTRSEVGATNHSLCKNE
jgi:hypothetical protein